MAILSFKEAPPEASIRGVNDEDKKKRYSSCSIEARVPSGKREERSLQRLTLASG